MLMNFLRSGRRATPSTDMICCWEGSSSDLGFEGADAPSEGAGPAAVAGASNSPSDESAADAGAERAEVAAEPEDDPNADPLDALSSDEEEADPKATERAPETPREKMLKLRARKLERAYKKALPTVSALREAGLDVKQLLQRHQTLSNLEASIERNPRLRALIYGGDDTDSAPASGGRASARAAADAITESFLANNPAPFDTNDDVGRWMAGFVKHVEGSVAQLHERLQDTATRAQRVEQGIGRQTTQAIRTEWKTATDAAAKELVGADGKPNTALQRMFADAMYGAYENAMAGRHKMTPAQVVDHYLKELRVSKKSSERASAAVAQRTATHNNNLPRRPAGGTGQPASPRSKTVPRLESFNRDMQRRFGAA